MNKAIPAEFKPNNEIECCVCTQTPTVDIYVNGSLENSTELCGVCTWGESACADPENW
ncbi:hypothetical protein ACCQ10_09200 [Xanthomonas sp. NCPPB 1325]|uniref:hypothetical protein n=1 Tax=Xanthomonas sp. NCPPB 1325 TaxID=487529 RepID=UPI003558FC51